jgi:hypothetical protein
MAILGLEPGPVGPGVAVQLLTEALSFGMTGHALQENQVHLHHRRGG